MTLSSWKYVFTRRHLSVNPYYFFRMLFAIICVPVIISTFGQQYSACLPSVTFACSTFYFRVYAGCMQVSRDIYSTIYVPMNLSPALWTSITPSLRHVRLCTLVHDPEYDWRDAFDGTNRIYSDSFHLLL